MSAVLPRCIAVSAAETPAGPPPIIITSVMYASVYFYSKIIAPKNTVVNRNHSVYNGRTSSQVKAVRGYHGRNIQKFYRDIYR